MSATNKYKGLFNWTLLLVILVGIIAVNVISAFVYKRIDMTADQRYSLSEGTIKLLSDEKKISNRLTIRIYLEGTMPAEIKHFRNAIEDKLNEFKQYAGSRIEYKFIDPNGGTEEEQQELKDQLYNKGEGILNTILHIFFSAYKAGASVFYVILLGESIILILMAVGLYAAWAIWLFLILFVFTIPLAGLYLWIPVGLTVIYVAFMIMILVLVVFTASVIEKTK